MEWWEKLNTWRFGFFKGGQEEDTETIKDLIPSFSKPKSLILPAIIIGGLAAYFLLIKK